MPLKVADGPVSLTALKDTDARFLVFFSSIVGGKLWCPDCVNVDATVKKIFEPEDGPSALLVYVGDMPTWKARSNKYRGEPWKVNSVPTIIRLKDGVEDARLTDSSINSRLREFVKEQ